MAETSDASLQELFKFFQGIASLDIERYNSGTEKLSLPVIPPPLVCDICHRALEIFRVEETLLKIDTPVVVVGDIHGHIVDLLRILHECGFPPARRYLFLGDFVDRGEFSSECVVFVLLLKILFPEYVWLIRGNHEFSDLWMHCGFATELARNYQGSLVGEGFTNVLTYMPLGALLFGSVLCIHGGLGPSLTCVEQINQIPRPVLSYESEPIASLMWSDPTTEIEYYRMSSRGLGFLFGEKALHTFLENEGLNLLVRGHECVDGIQWGFQNKLVTVFSASNYCGIANNRSGVLFVNGKNEYEGRVFGALRYLRRYNVRFVDVRSPIPPSGPVPVSRTVPCFSRGQLGQSQSMCQIAGVQARQIAKVTVTQGKNEKIEAGTKSMRSVLPRAMAKPLPHRRSQDRGQYMTYEQLSDSSSTDVITPANGYKKFRQSMNARDVRSTPTLLTPTAEATRISFRFSGLS